MTVEKNKLETIAATMRDQARLLRLAGSLSQANGMERRAAELHALCVRQEMALTDRHAA